MESFPVFLLALLVTCAQCSKLTTLYEWSKIDFIYSQRDQDLSSGRLKPEDVVLVDSEIFRNGSGMTVFVTTPKLIPGTPISLSTVSETKDQDGFLLTPFPDYSWHTPGPCQNTFVNAYRMRIDELGRLWILDTGIDFRLPVIVPQKICPPKIVVFDLKNRNNLLRSYEFPEDQLKNHTRMYNILVDVQNNGSDTFVYIADPKAFTLFVYDYSRNTSHFIHHPYFYPDPLYGYYNTNGVKNVFMDGILHYSLGYKNRERMLFFHSLSGARECYVPTRILNNAHLSKDPYQYFIYPKERDFHAGPEVMYNNIMIFSNLEENSLLAWDTRTSYDRRHFNVLEKDTERLQFPSILKIFEDKIVVVSNRLQNLFAGHIARGEVNYRILLGSIRELLKPKT